MKPAVIGSVVTFCFLMATSSFAAADDVLFSPNDGNFIVFGGIGIATIKAQEFVYGDGCTGTDEKCSQLNWQSKGVTLFTLGAEAQIDNDWSLKGNVSVGASGGNGHMVDTDWDFPGHDDWSDRSIHPQTELDHYVAGAIELDRIIYRNETGSFAVGAGFRYTDVQWTAYGGFGIHSEDGFRDLPVTWPDWERGISYRQKIPVGFLSLGGEQAFGNLTISGGVQGGLSLGMRGIDDHWGDFRTYDDMHPAPTIGATVGVNYALTPSVSLYLSGSFERVFHALGKELVEEDGKRSAWKKNVAAASFQSMSASFGLKVSF
ncbi:omptin family outer membrane protease [Mesorhizobium carmichaelinearum]|uniref:omptin family outer membrane protease n=1 Tax=Mesorhizobium carmichaelinearum TaxID=1208188 RepID=UPI000BA4678A|nr:omptin family outer membrane protease [Mesorhizobium carmichaelinearum]